MRLLLVVISLFISGLCAQAQTAKPIHWTMSLSKTEVKQGDVIEIIMKAEISPEWYLYSSDFSPDLGPTVSSITFTENGSFKAMGNLKPVGAKEKYDSLWEGKIRYFVKYAEFRQKVKILKVNPVIKGMLSYQVCSDKEGKCIPYDENILFNKLKVIASEIVPDKTPVTVNKKEEVVTPAATPTKNNLSALEAEKEKLIQKDNNGKDIAVEQLKTFSQKYGGNK
jgi:hypothetical protein